MLRTSFGGETCEHFRIGLCQINTTVGDIEGNTKKILDYIAKGKKMGADLLAFPEMAVTGYPPEDLLFMPKFIEANLKAIRQDCPGHFFDHCPRRFRRQGRRHL